MGEKVTLIESCNAVVREVKNILSDTFSCKNCRRKNNVSFYVTDDPECFDKLGSRFMNGIKIRSQKVDL
jgi:glutamate racemase